MAEAESGQLQGLAEKWAKLPVEVHVFDFKNVENVDPHFYDHFISFKKMAQAKNTQVISINFRPRMLEKIKKEGREKTLGYVASIDAVQPSGAKDSDTEVRNWLVKYLVAASRSAMNTMFNTTVAADENYRENIKAFRLDEFYRIAYVEAKGRLISARFYLCFDKKTLEALTRIFLPSTTIPLDDELISSTATELLNLMYGVAKSKINDERAYDLPNAIPVLISPSEAAKGRAADAKNICVIPFATPVGSYYLEIDFST